MSRVLQTRVAPKYDSSFFRDFLNFFKEKTKEDAQNTWVLGIFCDRDFWTDSDRAEAAEYEYEVCFCPNPCKQKLWTTSGI